MIEVLNWYADHPVLGTIALMFVCGAVANWARIIRTLSK